MPTPAEPAPRRWLMLALGTAAQTAASTLLFGLPFLLPALREEDQLTLAQAGALVAAPSLGLVLTLILWGAFADRYGERLALWSGLGLTGVLALAAAPVDAPWARGLLLVLVGAAGASVNAASGRLVMGWFGADQRGLAMGIRQMGQPLGVAVAAVLLPPLDRAGGITLAIAGPAVLCLAVAVLLLVLAADPRRADASGGDGTRPRSPYRQSWALARVHLASALLVVPQFATATFSAEYLVAQQHWDAADAGRVLAVVALAGALGRLAVGRWSDLVGSRLRPMRQVALLSALTMALVAAAIQAGSPLVLAALAAASVVSVTDNGLGFTATAELAGTAWSGRALGTQNTAQNVAAFLTGPLVGALAGARGYGTAFAACVALPLLGACVVPVRAER
ncbi:MAG: MFS transporter [Oryzihumus sp.]